MHQEREIQDGDRPELRLLEIAPGGALDAVDDVEEAVASLGDEGFGVEGEAGLELPEAAEADSGAEGDVCGEEAGEAGEEEAEEGGEGGDGGGEGVAFGFEVGGLDGGF